MKRKLTLVALLGIAIGALVTACNQQPAADENNPGMSETDTNAPMTPEQPATNTP